MPPGNPWLNKVGLCECGCHEKTKIALKTSRRDGTIKGKPLRFVKGHNRCFKSGSLNPMHGKIGSLNPMYGKVGALRGKNGSRHHSWKLDAGYEAIHVWLSIHKPRTGVCDHCGNRPKSYKGRTVGTDNALVSGIHRREVDAYIELCRRCHIKFDKSRRDKELQWA